jgi:hypothetical protein
MEEVIIQKNSSICEAFDSTNIIPDYFAEYVFAQGGEYTLTLTADNGNGPKILTKTIRVIENPPLVITRQMATRLYPAHPAPATITIRFNTDFTGTITERLPADFVILSASTVKQEGGNQMNTDGSMQPSVIDTDVNGDDSTLTS